jgi:hypothetical protein
MSVKGACVLWLVQDFSEQVFNQFFSWLPLTRFRLPVVTDIISRGVCCMSTTRHGLSIGSERIN